MNPLLPALEPPAARGHGTPGPYQAERAAALARFEFDYVCTMLAATQGNVSEAARRAGKDRRVFGRMMKRHGIRRERFEPS